MVVVVALAVALARAKHAGSTTLALGFEARYFLEAIVS
jgi:hypothetical protein